MFKQFIQIVHNQKLNFIKADFLLTSSSKIEIDERTGILYGLVFD